jgi:hypothetical protein
MRIVGKYSFKDGERIISEEYAPLLEEVRQVIANVNALVHKTKVSREKTMPGRMLYNPRSLNNAFRREFQRLGWVKQRVRCEYSQEYYTEEYSVSSSMRAPFREMDFLKGNLGVEVQFGKYAFMVYNVCAKMTIFAKFGFIKVGVEVVPVWEFASEMSTGVSYFEQIVWDLEHRGEADIDIPVLVLGVAQ